MKNFSTFAVSGLALTLCACGGGGGDSAPVNPGPDSGESIVACFTADNTVNFAMATLNAPSGNMGPSRSTTGPMTYNGQAVTGQMASYQIETVLYTTTNYWSVASNGITFIANKDDYSGTTTPINVLFPQNMSPGQTVSNAKGDIVFTFVGLETLSLAGKTFSNTCHIKQTHQNGTDNIWYAPGYGLIKEVDFLGVTAQYNGDL
jgi:hypothetical protein